MPQTKVVKVIDPGGTGDYTSLQEWATARAGDITANGRNTIEIAKCICTNGKPDSIANLGTLFKTDAAHYVKIYADSLYRHKGVYPASGSHIYRIEATPSISSLLQVTTSKVIIEGICFNDSLGQGNCITLTDCDAGGYVSGCLLKRIKTSADEHGNGIRVDAVTKYSKYYINNNIIYGFNNDSLFTPGNCGILTYPTGDSITVYIDNNTIYNCKYGIWNRGGEDTYKTSWATVRNNLVQNPAPIMNSADFNDQAQYTRASSNNISLPASTPINTVLIPNSSFENGTTFPFIPDSSYACLEGYPAHSGSYCFSVNKNWAPIDLYTACITGLAQNTDYTFSFYNAYGGGDVFTVYLTNATGEQLGNCVITTTNSTYIKQSIKFNSDINTAFVIHITNSDSSWGKCYIDDLQLYTGDSTCGNAYFENVSGNNFHLKSTGVLAIGQGLNLSADANDPFNDDIDYGTRLGAWDIGADQYNAGNTVDTTISNMPGLPTLLFPDGSSNIPDTASSILFTWKRVLFVSSYEFQIAPDNKFKTILIDTAGITDTVFIYYPNHLPSTFYWRVRCSNLVGIGLWSVPMAVSLITGINTKNKNTPIVYELCQNYPNPFNPSTIINYQLAVSGKVVLKVYDMLGRELITLVDENQNEGSHSVQLSANSYHLSSGVYYYQLRTRSFVQVKKMLLLK